MILDHEQLRAFSATVECGTLDAAACSLSITQSAVSQRIKTLEADVGSVLLKRTKPVQVTESGQHILLLARQIEQLRTDATDRLRGSESIRTKVSIAVNADSLATWVMPALKELAGQICFEVHREDEEYATALLREGQVMAAITSEAVPVQGCRSIRLGTMRYRAMASTHFAKQWFPHGITAEALADAPLVAFDRKDDLPDRFIRHYTRRQLNPPRNYIPSSLDYSEAVRGGLGWGLIPDLQRDSNSQATRLIDLDSDHSLEVKLFWQQWKLASPGLEQAATAILAAAARNLY